MNAKRAVTTVLATATLGWLTRAAWGLPAQIGASRAKVRPYAAVSPRYRGKQFHNSDPGSTMLPGSETGILKALITRGAAGRPRRPIPLATPLAPVEAADVAVTWYGHSSVLVEVDGYRVLADPVWSRRVSPSTFLGPSRMHPTPVPLLDLPAVDAIVISHDHYDHLDMATVRELTSSQKAPFVVPVGLGAHLRRWRVPEERIVELDWDEATTVGALTLTCTEARHFSGRGLVRNTTQWASWVLAGPERKVFFGGDSGYTPRFADLGRRYGPFDLTLLPVGAYDPRWADIHMNPEEAVQTHTDLEQGDATRGLLVPVHWATFNLAFHAWSEPIVRLVEAAKASGTTVAVPMPGQRIDVAKPTPQTPWWITLG
ncbi:MBL fold metallo-hydrolase [Rhodococcus tibetensis]|uniref:MBL fold metallo-hydrolase n=1 Tax=Rhodococcus tibetensis TaxID=2965064 RepID=A0ABT1QA86_9NOCA|nr:MBL fold metallo-hydrolase [Rhodococcus sp. FXJ9.536]MCQ4118032.1 MBL fold metallo-hydrolase [Rhodococcus sp. FXJ9.536]